MQFVLSALFLIPRKSTGAEGGRREHFVHFRHLRAVLAMAITAGQSVKMTVVWYGNRLHACASGLTPPLAKAAPVEGGETRTFVPLGNEENGS